MSAWNFLTTTQLGGNTVLQIAGLFAIILVGLLTGKVGRAWLVKLAVKFDTRNRHLLAIALRSLAKSLVVVCFTVAAKLSFAILTANPDFTTFLNTMIAVLAIFAGAYVLYAMIDVVDQWMNDLMKQTDSHMNAMFASVVGKSIRITIVILAILQVATILSDKPLTSVIAGLGVGGLAVALAAQDTIKNFFGSLVLMVDRPFLVGERVVVDGHDGAVEDVGLRSTRIRTLDGHLVTIPNGELANKTIQNIGKRPYIKRVMNVTIAYDTPPAKVLRALEIIRDILNDHEGMDADFPPRVFFSDFNSDSLNILVIFWYHPPDYWDFLAFAEKVNLEILNRFNNEGIEFAFPTQTVYLAGDHRRPVEIGTYAAQGGKAP